METAKIGGATQLKQGVNEMRLVDLQIEDIAFGGKGVAREQGKAVFVPYTIEGELVSAEIIREKKQFAEADLVEVKESSAASRCGRMPIFRSMRRLRVSAHRLRTPACD